MYVPKTFILTFSLCNRKLNSRNSLQKHTKINKSCIILQLKNKLNENNDTKEEGNKTDE